MSTIIRSVNYDAQRLLAQHRERELIDAQLGALGFQVCNQKMRGFMPHFRRGDDLVFIAGTNTFLGRVTRIAMAFHDHAGKVYMVVPDGSPASLTGDLINSKRVIPLKMCPVRTARFSDSASGYEWVPYRL